MGCFPQIRCPRPPAPALCQQQPGVTQMGTRSKWLPKPSFAMTAVVNEGQKVGEGEVLMIHRIATLPRVKTLLLPLWLLVFLL